MPIIIYGDSQSGNCYKLKLLCSFLNIDHQWIEVNIMEGETHTDAFLEMNPNAKIPLLVTEQKNCIAESNAILYYLSQNTPLFPKDTLQQALCLQWMFFEQYSHEPYIAVARFINKYLGTPADRVDDLVSKQEGGHKALAVMEIQLQKSKYLLGDSLTIADISLFAYTHLADEGGFDLSKYPAVLAWVYRIEAQTDFIQLG